MNTLQKSSLKPEARVSSKIMVKYFKGAPVESWFQKKTTNEDTEVQQVSTRFKLNVCACACVCLME